MRGIVVAIVAVCCVAALGQPAAAPGRGMDFKFGGPAAEMLPAFEAALGMGAEPKEWPKTLQGPDGEKPVAVLVKNARSFDLLAAVEKAAGRRLEFGEGWAQPRLQPSPLPGRVGASPGFSTVNTDVVLERVERAITYPLTWGDDGPLAAAPQSVLTVTLRTYPADMWVADRLVGFLQPGLTLVQPDGKPDFIPIWQDRNGATTPFGRCLRALRRQVPVEDLPAGEYKLGGALLMAKVDPVESQALTAADVGRTVDLGVAKVTVRTWAGAQQPMRWEVDGPRPEMGMGGPNQLPTGVVWIEARGRGKTGEVLWPAGGGGGFNGTRYQGDSFWGAEPATVEFRALIIGGPEDMVQEPFEIAFTLPGGFVGK